MAELNSYLGMAENDRAYAVGGMSVGDSLGNYNGVASIAAQSGEKYLKAILERVASPDDGRALELMKGHNLRAILNQIKKYREISLSSKDVKWLGDFYFDARYPGDYFVEVPKSDALEVLKLLEEVRKVTMDILEIIDTVDDSQIKGSNTFLGKD